MLEELYRKGMEDAGPSGAELERFWARMERADGRSPRRALRAAVAAAAVCAALVTTVAAAYLMGAFDFLKKQDEYAALGMNEVYETYAREVNATATAENGDMLTVERVAMDGKLCTIFYSVRFSEPLMSEAEFETMKNDDTPDLWQAYFREPYLNLEKLYAGEEEVSRDAYDNSFEPQQYFAAADTICGAWRFLLSRPLAEGESVRLMATSWHDRQPSGAATLTWELGVGFEAHPIQAEHFEPDVAFTRHMAGKSGSIEVLSLDRSPLGTFLTLRSEKLQNISNLDFALRDADTGAYIPYAEVVVNNYWDPEGYDDLVYELYGDVSGVKNLELIPTRKTGSTSPRIAAAVSDLPASSSGNPAGGYAPASYEVKGGRLVVTMKPLGAVNGQYPRLVNGVYFLDAAGNELFHNISVQKFKDRSDGTITVVSTPDEASFRRDVDKVAQIWFFVLQYELTDQMIKIPLQ